MTTAIRWELDRNGTEEAVVYFDIENSQQNLCRIVSLTQTEEENGHDRRWAASGPRPVLSGSSSKLWKLIEGLGTDWFYYRADST
jgi:hypothetical protein